MNCQLNNEKVWSIKGKTTKSSITFRRNKPNFQHAQMNVNIYYTKDYQILSPWPDIKTNPIQTQSNPVLSAFILSFVEVVEWANLQKAKMNVNITLTKDYRKKDDFVVRINKPNFQNAQNERKLICYRGL